MGKKNKRKRGQFHDKNVKHFPKKVRPEHIENLARVYFGGTYYCVGEHEKKVLSE